MPRCETSHGIEFQKRAAALADALKDPKRVPGRELVGALKQYLAFLAERQRESASPGGVGPGTAAEINATLWETFPLADDKAGETGGLRRLLVDLSALAVRDFRLYPPRPQSKGPQLTYYQDWRASRKLSDDEVLLEAVSGVLTQEELFEADDGSAELPALEAKAELLLAAARVAQFLGYTGDLALRDLKAALGPGKGAEREKPLDPKHYLRFQVLALPDGGGAPFSPSALDELPPPGTRKGAKPRPAPPRPEDPASIWAAVRRWSAADPFCDHLFRRRWRWLADHAYSQPDAAEKQRQQEWLGAADPFTAKLAKAWERKSATPDDLLRENPDWLRSEVPAETPDDPIDEDEIEEDDDE
jgi:hypothetical protein